MADSVVTIGADLSELRRDLAKLPNLSSQAAQKTLIQVEKVVQKAERAAKRSARTVSRANRKAMREAEKAAKDARDGFKGLIELSGASGDKIDKLGAVFNALSSPIGVATLGVTGLGLAVAGSVAGVVGLVKASQDLAKELEPYREIEGFDGIDESALASITGANAAMDSLGVLAKQAVVTLGAEFAPVVETAAKTLLKLGLVALDAFNAFADGKDVLREVAVFLADQLVKAFLGPIEGVMSLIGLMGDLASAVGADGLGEALSFVEDKWDGLTRSIAEAGVDLIFEKTGDAVGGLNVELSDYDARVEAIIGKTAELTSASRSSTKAKKEESDAEKQLLEDIEARLKAQEQAADIVSGLTEHRLSEIERISLAEEEALEKLLATEVATQEQIFAVQEEFSQRRQDLRDEEAQAAEELAKKAADEARSIQEAYLSAASQMAGAAADFFGNLADDLVENNKAGAEAAFAVAKVAGLAQVAIDTALAVSQINAAWSAQPQVAAVLSAAAVATGAASAAAIASEQLSYHIGGVVRPQVQGSQYAPDEVPIRAQVGEAVLTRRAAERLGPQGVNALNRGEGLGGAVMVVQTYKHRTFDAFIQDHLDLPESKLRRAIRGSGRVGHRNRS